jgi:CRP/FNR family transcriptional regulator
MPSARHPPLPDLPLFRALTPEAARVLAAAPRGRYGRGQTLWTAGAEARALVIVLSGRVRVVRAVAAGRSAGRQYGVHAEGPGGTLGEVPFFAGGRYPATAIATEPTACLLLDRATLARAVAADPELALRWLGRLAGRVRRLIERLDEQTARTVQQRVAALLLARHAAAGGAPFALAATQAEAAEELGTVREVLVRTLRRFRDAGLVGSPARGRYVVRDRSALARVAAP